MPALSFFVLRQAPEAGTLRQQAAQAQQQREGGQKVPRLQYLRALARRATRQWNQAREPRRMKA
jgi:hypothetical protein